MKRPQNLGQRTPNWFCQSRFGTANTELVMPNQICLTEFRRHSVWHCVVHRPGENVSAVTALWESSHSYTTVPNILRDLKQQGKGGVRQLISATCFKNSRRKRRKEARNSWSDGEDAIPHQVPDPTTRHYCHRQLATRNMCRPAVNVAIRRLLAWSLDVSRWLIGIQMIALLPDQCHVLCAKAGGNKAVSRAQAK